MIFGRAKLNFLVPDWSNYQEHLWRLSHKDPKDLANPEKQEQHFFKLNFFREIKNTDSSLFVKFKNTDSSFFVKLKIPMK